MKLALMLVLTIALIVFAAIFIINIKTTQKLTSALLGRERTMSVFKEKNDMYEQWLKVMYGGKSLGQYIRDCGYIHIALYGLGESAKLLIKELEREGILVDFIIEPNWNCNEYAKHKVKRSFDKLKETDAVIITEFADYETVMDKLESMLECPVLALDDLLFMINTN